MKLPPISRSFRVVRNGQPSVWITWSSGFATRHTSFTPRLHACGNSPRNPNRSIAAPARCPCVPSDNTVAWACTSTPGSYDPSGSPSRPSPLSPVLTPRTAPSATSSLCCVSLRQHHRSQLLRQLRHVPSQLRQGEHQVALVVERRRRRDPHLEGLAHQVDGFLRDRPEAARQRRHVLTRQQVAQRRRIHHSARQQVRSRHPSLVKHRDRRLAQPLGRRRVLRQQLSQPDRAGQPGRACPDEDHAHVDALVLLRLRSLDELAHLDRGWVCARAPCCHAGDATRARSADARLPPPRPRHQLAAAVRAGVLHLLRAS